MGEASRWTALRAGREGGEQVQERGDTKTNATGGGRGRIEGRDLKIQKLLDTGGVEGLE